MIKYTDEDYKEYITDTLIENGPYLWSWWQRDSSAFDRSEYVLSEHSRVLGEMVRDGTVKFIEVPKVIPVRRGKPMIVNVRIYYMDGGKWNSWLTDESFIRQAIR